MLTKWKIRGSPKKDWVDVGLEHCSCAHSVPLSSEGPLARLRGCFGYRQKP